MSNVEHIKYITPEDLINIIDIIRSLDYEYAEEVPNYDSEREGIDKYFSLIDRMRQEYYPDIYSKATFLFLNVNSHYFSNGNKRLAVVSMTTFLESNMYTPIDMSKDEYRNLLIERFSDSELNDWENFSPIDFAMYNLAIITAEQNKIGTPFDDVKDKVESFLKQTFKFKKD